MSASKKDEDFQITKEELDKFQKAMQNEEFRKLLLDYAEEISDPENKKKYEEEIAQMERERGMDIKFVNPEEGFVVKTARVKDDLKAFVNICHNEHIQKASSHLTEKEENGVRKKGQQWSIPFSLSQPRDDFDNAGKKCVVFDVVFHPETYQKGQQDPRFKETMITTALDGINKQLNVKLNNKNLKFPKLKFKGVKQPTVIRTKSKEQSEKPSDNNINIGGQSYPYPYSNEPHHENKKQKKKAKNNSSEDINIKEELLTESETKKKPANEPVYHILHRGVIDFQNFTNARDSCTSTRPKELVVTIQLPKLKSTGTVELDIFEKQLILHNDEPLYHLDLALPFPVDDANGHAKFDKSRHELIVTLPVVKPDIPPLPHTNLPVSDDDQNKAADEEKKEECNSNNDSKNKTISCNDNSDSQETYATNISNCNEGSSRDFDLKDVTEKKQLNEIMNGNDSEMGSNGDKNLEAINTAASKGCDLTESDEDFVLMDDIIQVDHTDEGIHCRNKELDVQDLHFELPSDLTDMSLPFFFKSPPYSFHQDTDTVTFIVHVAGVAMENVSLGFNENKCYINFPSEKTKPHQLPPPDYALYISFADGHNLAPDNCNIDVTKENLLLTLAKDDACKGLWDGFKAGHGEEELEDKFFITDNNVELMMQEIADQDPWAQQTSYAANVKVLSVADDHLTVELRKNLADAVKDSQETRLNGHVQQGQNVQHKEESCKCPMESAKLENLDLKEGILSNKMQELKLQKLTSPDEGIEYDMYSHERREKYSNGLTERIAASTDPKLVQEHGHKASADERRKNRSDSIDSTSDRSDSGDRRKSRSDSLDSVSSDRSDLTSSSSAIPTRKSCIRRSSSTSTDEDSTDYEWNNPMSPSNGSWGSPGKRNVRFNLNPSVRVFSNKKDKQRWKMEQRLKNQKLAMRDNSEDKVEKEATIHEHHEEGSNDAAESRTKRQDSESSVDDEWTIVDRPSENSLSNNLIFELDE